MIDEEEISIYKEALFKAYDNWCSYPLRTKETKNDILSFSSIWRKYIFPKGDKLNFQLWCKNFGLEELNKLQREEFIGLYKWDMDIERNCFINKTIGKYFNPKEDANITTEYDLQNYLMEKTSKIPDLDCMRLSPRDFGRGVPDIELLIKNSLIMYIELKSPNETGHLSMEQIRYHEFLRDAGFPVKVIWTKEQVDTLLSDLDELLERYSNIY